MATNESLEKALVKKEKEITPFERIEDFILKSAKSLGETLPKHLNPERLNRLVLSLLRMTPKLQECSPMSITAAVFQMAQLGLEPIDGQAFIIPYTVNKQDLSGKWIKEKQAQFQIGFKGLVTLYYRHQLSGSLTWDVVKENDIFHADKAKGILSHEINFKKDRGEPYAYWVKATLHNGAEMFGVMSKIEVEKHAREHSKAFDKKTNAFIPGTPWEKDFDSMAQKTVLIQLFKLLPKSVEIQQALAMDETTKTSIDTDMSMVPDETIWDAPKTIDVSFEEPAYKEEAALSQKIDQAKKASNGKSAKELAKELPNIGKKISDEDEDVEETNHDHSNPDVRGVAYRHDRY
jgi:recombination protein RecT